ncbi:MAG: TatD family hydrolase [Treponema sp.]|jgi:TatD DNase family protein|nr:TatD family hydrolase [Treponema sp.]
MRLIDIGVNLMSPAYNMDREAAVQSAFNAGVSPLVITGVTAAESSRALSYARNWNTRSTAQDPAGVLPSGRLYTTAGVHPHDAKSCNGGTIADLTALAGDRLVLAIGECGLDYNRNFSPQPVQREWFEKQIELAADLSLPLFLHERDAFTDFSLILERHRDSIKAMVVHCFTGGERELEKYLSLGAYIGLTGWVCDERRGSHLLPLLKMIPSDRLLLETDAPFLFPRNLSRQDTQPPPGPGGSRFRGGRNEPRFLPHIACFIAAHLGKDTEVLCREAYENTCRFFGRDFEE